MAWAPAALLLASNGARADPAIQREDQFKAAYVFNFVKFVEWPGDVSLDPVTICFVGAEGVYEALTASIDSKRAGSRRLVARRVADAPAAGTCNALYVEAAMVSRHSPIQERAVLTISDSKNFVANGGMIELFTENHRLRFRINARSAQRAGLRISSDLLKLAVGVHREPR